MDMNDSEGENDNDMPIFTSELEAMKNKAKGEDNKMSEEGSEDPDDLGEGEEAPVNDYPSEFSDSEEEKEDFTIRKSDALLVAATTEKDFSTLEVYVYEYKTSSLYVHHDITLSSYPLCLEWIKDFGGHKCNLVAVGSFLPQIEIWNLDVLEAVQPDLILGEVADL